MRRQGGGPQEKSRHIKVVAPSHNPSHKVCLFCIISIAAASLANA
jgi:hypothetical protein